MPTKKPVAQDIQVQIQKWLKVTWYKIAKLYYKKAHYYIWRGRSGNREIPILISEGQISNTKKADKSKSKSKFWDFVVDREAHKTWAAITTHLFTTFLL